MSVQTSGSPFPNDLSQEKEKGLNLAKGQRHLVFQLTVWFGSHPIPQEAVMCSLPTFKACFFAFQEVVPYENYRDLTLPEHHTHLF